MQSRAGCDKAKAEGLTHEFHASEDYKRRFLQEAKAAAGLNHPNIVSIPPIASLGFAASDLLVECSGNSANLLGQPCETILPFRSPEQNYPSKR